MIHVFDGTLADVPGPLADQLAATTGPDGSATIDFLPERAQLVAVQLTAAPDRNPRLSAGRTARTRRNRR